MKGAKLVLAAIFLTIGVGLAVSAIAADEGLKDSHGVWHDADYWHARHPDWVYRYHPEWAVDRQDWWMADHRDHPEWFESPYWRRYPVWTYGAYDRGHVWRDAGWVARARPGLVLCSSPGMGGGASGMDSRRPRPSPGVVSFSLLDRTSSRLEPS
jgi:hypothetical protein